MTNVNNIIYIYNIYVLVGEGVVSWNSHNNVGKKEEYIKIDSNFRLWSLDLGVAEYLCRETLECGRVFRGCCGDRFRVENWEGSFQRRG